VFATNFVGQAENAAGKIRNNNLLT